jgi:CheY-like chemotaxis protein
MDGATLIRALRAMAPAIPIIASTGLGEKAQMEQLKASGVEHVLHKPYSSEPLVRAIYEIIHVSAAPPNP